jgi:hypothetical protein
MMKVSFWDILAILGVLVLIVFVAGLAMIFFNPYSAINPFPPATLPARVVIPSVTATLPKLPATWTPAVSTTVEIPVVISETLPPLETAEVLPSLPPMNTFTLTPTETPLSTATFTPAPNQALWIANTPADYTVLSPGQEFDMIWKIQNTGVLTWTTRYSYKYISGEPIHEKSEYGVKKSIAPGSVAELMVDMRAPTTAGSYRTVWGLYDDAGKQFYTFNFAFSVK